MHDNLTHLCADELERYVEKLFNEAERLAKPELARGQTNVKAPVIGIWYDSWSDEQAERAQRLARAALAACEWHRRCAPIWALPLPVHCDELDHILNRPLPRQLLLQKFACSMRHYDWDLRHPPLPNWARTVMAYKGAPDILREDADLRAEFPPRKLCELWGPGTPDPLNWTSPEMAARNEAFSEFRRLRNEGVPMEEARRMSGFYPR